MIFFQTIAVAFAMFSAVPVPQFQWNEKNMRYAMCAFPLIGLVIGGLWSLCYGDREKKLEILKDPHCGAFAVIRLCSYFLAYFALCTAVQFTPRTGFLWTLALVLERALSGLAVAAFPMAKNTGLAHTFASAADRRVLFGLAFALCAALTALGGWGLVLAAVLVFVRYYVVSKKQFGGITGDLAGWFLQKAELWMLAALCACQWGGLL